VTDHVTRGQASAKSNEKWLRAQQSTTGDNADYDDAPVQA